MTIQITTDLTTNDRKKVTTRLCAPGFEVINPYEMKAINSLLAWVASEQGSTSEKVRAMTACRFGVADISALRRKDYDEVVSFLIGLRVDETNV